MTSGFLLIFGHPQAILGTLYTNVEHSITLSPLALVISPTYIFPYLRDRKLTMDVFQWTLALSNFRNTVWIHAF